MLVKVKREELFQLDRTLDSVSSMPSTRFAYAVARNKKAIQAELESSKTAIAPSPKVLEFEEKRQRLVMEMAAKKPDGSPDVDRFGNARVVDPPLFNNRLGKLKEEYKSELEEFETKQPEREAFLKEDIELELYEISLKHLPKELKASDVYMLMPVLSGDPSELPE